MAYKDDLDKAKAYAQKQREKQNVSLVKHFYDKPKKKPAFSKLMLLFLIINCSVIEVFSMVCMWCFRDLTPLGGLIAAVCTETIGTIGYFIKSAKENSESGITYSLAMREQDRIDSGNCDEEAVG